MKLPTISVIMATYNHAEFVAQAIESVLNQKGVDFEFLIADDGSVDGTRSAVEVTRDPRIRFFPNEVNRGACEVTNELIQKANGEFVALINSDDYWIGDDKLSYQLQFMRENPKVGACFGRAKFVDKNGLQIEKSTLEFGVIFDQANRSRGAWLRRFFDLGNCICHPTMLIRRACYADLGLYSNRMRQLPDLDMWIRLVKKYDIHISDREFINFRVLPGENASSQTTVNSIRTINEHYLIAEAFFKGIGREELVDGFAALLIHKDLPTIEHIDIEKALFYFVENQWLGKPYKMIGLLKINELLNNPIHHDLLVNSYGIDDRWFQRQMGDIDVLRPKIIATVSHQRFRILSAYKQFIAKF